MKKDKEVIELLAYLTLESLRNAFLGAGDNELRRQTLLARIHRVCIILEKQQSRRGRRWGCSKKGKKIPIKKKNYAHKECAVEKTNPQRSTK